MQPTFRLRFHAATLLLAAGLAVTTQQAAQTQGQDHPGQFERADVEAGASLYGGQCVACHGPDGNQVAGVDLKRQQFKTVVSDEDLQRLLTTGRPDAGMPAFATLQPREMTAIVAFIRAGFDATATAVRIGSRASGEALFSGKGGCAACHRVNGRGPRLAPDLSDVGSIRSAAALQRMVTQPTENLIPGNRTLVAVTRDGRTVRGRRLNEDTFTVQLIDQDERLVSLVKADLRSLDAVTQSAMPSVTGRLSDEEVADLIAYLLSLKGLP